MITGCVAQVSRASFLHSLFVIVTVGSTAGTNKPEAIGQQVQQ
jgi:hypothetical protein